MGLKIRKRALTCKNETSLIADYLSSNLPPPLLNAFEKHLKLCPDCAAFLETYKKTIDITRQFLKTQSQRHKPRRLKISSLLADRTRAE